MAAGSFQLRETSVLHPLGGAVTVTSEQFVLVKFEPLAIPLTDAAYVIAIRSGGRPNWNRNDVPTMRVAELTGTVA